MGIFDRLFKSRKTLPKIYQHNMNCMLDTIWDKKLRQKVYEKIREDPNSFTITHFDDKGIPHFGVKLNFFLKSFNEVTRHYERGVITDSERWADFEDVANAFGWDSYYLGERKIPHPADLREKAKAEATLLMQKGFSGTGEELFFKAVGNVLEGKNSFKEMREAKKWVDKAAEFDKQGRRKEAMECLEKAGKMDPDIRIKIDDKDKILGIADEAETESELKWLYKKGLEFHLNHEYERAIACYDKVLKKDSQNVDAYVGKILSLSFSGKMEEARGLELMSKIIDPSFGSKVRTELERLIKVK